MQADVEEYLMIVGKNTIRMYEQAEKLSRPYLEGAVKGGQAAWQEGGKQLREGARWAEENYGDLASNVWEEVIMTISDIMTLVTISAGEAHVPQSVGAGGLGVAPGPASSEGGVAGLQTLLSSVRKVHYREELRAVAVFASQFPRLHGDAVEKFH